MNATRFVLALVAAVALWGASSHTAVSSPAQQPLEVTVQVDGLSCPFCAYGIEKKLKKVDGFELSGLNIKEGTATLIASIEKPGDYEALRKAVKDAGFTPREIHVAGTGRLENAEGQAALFAEDGTKLFLLEENDTLAGLGSQLPVDVRFVGTVVAREKSNGASGTPSLALTTVTPRDEQEG